MRARASLFVMVVLSTALSQAEILTITQMGTGGGTIAGVPFPASAFTITSIVDTANRQTHDYGFFIDNSSASISITGVGDFGFLSPTRIYVHNSGGGAGFSRGGAGGLDLYSATAPAAAFLTWNMLGPVGPVTLDGVLFQWTGALPGWTPIVTTGGVMIFNEGPSVMTFTAAVPEPTSLLLLSVGRLLIGRRRPIFVEPSGPRRHFLPRIVSPAHIPGSDRDARGESQHGPARAAHRAGG